MKLPSPFTRRLSAVAATGALALALLGSASAVMLPNTPLLATLSASPLTLLVVGRDHKLFYEAYNDASDLDGDGTLDIHFKPGITYYGLFEAGVCYSYNGRIDPATSLSNSGLFEPASPVDANGKCAGLWSGNFLNYVSTSRIDAVRRVLYGGHREIDTRERTVLRRAYIPQDAHSWAKEYRGPAEDGYLISDYTPLPQPRAGRRHFFGNLTPTAGVNCANPDDCSRRPPWLSVVLDSPNRVWEWASTERPVLRDDTHGGTRTNYTVRVLACQAQVSATGCKPYPNGALKPVGLLHEYGENDAMLFGLLTGSYDRNMSGGILRKAIGSFGAEIDPHEGSFRAASAARMVTSLDALRIRDFNNGRTDNAYRGGWFTTGPMTEGQFVDWGNPLAEMMYEGLRYFAGKGIPTPAFQPGSTPHDTAIGLRAAAWDDPYGAGKAPWCAKANMLVLSDINPSFDSDQLPGSRFGNFNGDLAGLNVSSIARTITQHEPGVLNSTRFIGQSTMGNHDGAPTPKRIDDLATVRGLAPEEPTKQGSYLSAAVAYHGRTRDLNPARGQQNVTSYFVGLASPLPKIEFPSGGTTVSLVPFAKSVGGSVGGSAVSNQKGSFQPTNQIVDFHVDQMHNMPGMAVDASVNGGRPFAKFRINFEDVEQGADHDMDVIAEYRISALADGRVEVVVTPLYQAGSIKHSMGYVISGTQRDGVYLVVQDESQDRPYHLNVPPGRSAGYCDFADIASMPSDCARLPWVGGTGANAASTQVFQPASQRNAATLLRDPLWYAAKWGGFNDQDRDQRPGLTVEWDAQGTGDPDNYFLVQNPLKLAEALRASFDLILENVDRASASNVTTSSTALATDTRVFQATYNPKDWSGELRAHAVTPDGVQPTPLWEASRQLPSPDNRRIFTRSGGAAVEFRFANLSAAHQTALGSAAVVDYLRGDRSAESATTPGGLRVRGNALGDIVHSSPLYMKETETVFVSANDGMLHAFDAVTGRERFAYIPGSVLDRLAPLAQRSYSHRFLVDGELALSTAEQNAAQRVLVGALGRGGRGLFALDVTAPAAFGAHKLLWEIDGNDPDMGQVLGTPVIARLNDGRLVAVVGNGYNSQRGEAVLFLIDLADGSVHKLLTGVANGNGMATPTVLDTDGDGRIDAVYAGDLKGNVWKFDLRGANRTGWRSEFTAGSAPAPLFTARDAMNRPQPITAPIGVAVNNVRDSVHEGKRFVFFGTGSYMDIADPASKAVQTWYGLIDEDARILNRGQLRARSIVSAGTIDGRDVRGFSEAIENDMTGRRGWYVDLLSPSAPAAQGERIVTASRVYQVVQPVLIASSIIPGDDACEPGGHGYLNAIDPFTGAATRSLIFDVNNDKRFDSADMLHNAMVGSIDLGVGMPGEGVLVTNRLVVGGTAGTVGSVRINRPSNAVAGRLSWREIVR